MTADCGGPNGNRPGLWNIDAPEMGHYEMSCAGAVRIMIGAEWAEWAEWVRSPTSSSALTGRWRDSGHRMSAWSGYRPSSQYWPVSRPACPRRPGWRR